MATPTKRLRISQRRSMNGDGDLMPPPANAFRSPRNLSSPSVAHNTATGQSLSQSQQVTIHPLKKSLNRSHLAPLPQEPHNLVPQQKHSDDLLALQTQVNKLAYQVREFDAERILLSLHHEKEVKTVQARAETDAKRYEAAEKERLKLMQQQDVLIQELRELRARDVDGEDSDKKKIRRLEAENELLKEERTDLESRCSDLERQVHKIQVEEIEGKRSQLEQNVRETRAELEELRAQLNNVNGQLELRQTDNEELERQVLVLRSRTGDAEELELLKKELGEQIGYVRQLENQSRDQTSEIRKLTDERRNVQIVMEEKRALQTQLTVLHDAERRAGELEIQKEILEDEKRTWSTLLEAAGQDEDDKYETPEAIVKALINERIERALILDRLGTAESELTAKDETLNALEDEIARTQSELTQLKESAIANEASEDKKALRRSEQQRQLAEKEIDYLKAQLDTFSAEQNLKEGEATAAEQQHAEQISRLETLLDEHKQQISILQTQLTKAESAPPSMQPPSTPQTGQKRTAHTAHLDDMIAPSPSSQLGALQRKNKTLQLALQKSLHDQKLLATEFAATKAQLKTLRAARSTRILELRDNPTSQHAAIKASTLKLLRKENDDLLAQLQDPSLTSQTHAKIQVIPISVLEAKSLELSDLRTSIAQKEKLLDRQRTVWKDRATQFRNTIADVLGYKLTFAPGKPVRIRSLYYRAEKDLDALPDLENNEDVEDENYLEIDVFKGLMNYGGGPEGAYAMECEQLFQTWVRERGEVPCFLAALTLEFYERFGGGNVEEVEEE